MNGNTPFYDYVIIGGGIVGLSTACQLQRLDPQATILVVDKEPRLAAHQTSHNSGVIHAGVYYAPGSLKAAFCKRGAEATRAFCRQHRIPFRQPGKLLVATDQRELARMRALQQRCRDNGIDTELIDGAALSRLEPHIDGRAALLVADTGIVDFSQVAAAMAAQFQAQGGTIRTDCRLQQVIERPQYLQLNCSAGQFRTALAIGCAGLGADRVCDVFGIDRDFAIIPFRGEYYQLSAARRDWVSHLIYPIPDPAMPFLGVHLTPMIDGRLTVGPNAVLGWKREGYRQVGNLSLRDSIEMMQFGGFWKLLRHHYRAGCNELLNSWFKSIYLKRVQKYCPQLQLSDLLPYPTGIRAQAVMRDGTLVEDFLFAESERSFHVCNAPSPAATSSIPIGEHIATRAQHKRLQRRGGRSAEVEGA